MKIGISVAVSALAIAGLMPAQAHTPLNAEAAQAIVEACASHATGRDQSHGIVVVDVGGNLVAALRMDGNGTGIMALAGEKARASAAWGAPTSRLAAGVERNPAFGNAPNVVAIGGGVPIFDADGQTLIGGVGTSGEPQEDDEACGEVGITAAGLRSSRAEQ